MVGLPGGAAMAFCWLLQPAPADCAVRMRCQLTPDRSAVMLFPSNPSSGTAIEVDEATGRQLVPFAARTGDGLEDVTMRAMTYCTELPKSAIAGQAPGQCGAELGKQMWACLSGTQESFRRDVSDDQVTSRWLVNQHVATGFRELCGLATRNDDVFASFRSHPAMIQIIEHVTAERGQDYLSLLREHAPDLLAPKVLKRLQRADRLGGGVPMQIGGGVDLSPNTLRYAWVHAQLRDHFGRGKKRGWAAGWKVCEIGGGYGGQAALTLLLESQIREYVLYDQPEPAALASRFLETLASHQSGKSGRAKPAVRTVGAVEGNMGSVRPAAQDGGPCDLVISNYAVSELSVSLQWEYAQRLILDSVRGYFTVNFQHKHGSGNFRRVITSLHERGYEVDQYDEVPQTDDKGLNTVVVAVLPPLDLGSDSVLSKQDTPAMHEVHDNDHGEQLPGGSKGSLSVEELRGIAKLRRAKTAAGGEQAWADLPEHEQRATLETVASPTTDAAQTTSEGEEQELMRLTASARAILRARGGMAREALWAALAS